MDWIPLKLILKGETIINVHKCHESVDATLVSDGKLHNLDSIDTISALTGLAFEGLKEASPALNGHYFCINPAVFPKWECLWHGLRRRHLQAVWPACWPGADDVQPRQHHLRHHLGGFLQEWTAAPGRLWWLQLQCLGHPERRACRYDDLERILFFCLRCWKKGMSCPVLRRYDLVCGNIWPQQGRHF